jgi:hypothetical protein
MVRKIIRMAGVALATAVAVTMLLPTSAHAASYWQRMPVFAGGTECANGDAHNGVQFQGCFGFSAGSTHIQGLVSVYNTSPNTRHFVQAVTQLYSGDVPVPSTRRECPTSPLSPRNQAVCLTGTIPNPADVTLAVWLVIDGTQFFFIVD